MPLRFRKIIPADWRRLQETPNGIDDIPRQLPNDEDLELSSSEEEEEDVLYDIIPRKTVFQHSLRLQLEAYMIIRNNPRLLTYCFWLRDNIGEPLKIFLLGFPGTYIWIRKFKQMDRNLTEHGRVSPLMWCLLGEGGLSYYGSRIGDEEDLHPRLLVTVASMGHMQLFLKFGGFIPLHALLTHSACDLPTVQYFVENYQASLLKKGRTLNGRQYYPIMIALNAKCGRNDSPSVDVLEYLSQQTIIRLKLYNQRYYQNQSRNLIFEFWQSAVFQAEDTTTESPLFLTYVFYNFIHASVDVLFLN